MYRGPIDRSVRRRSGFTILEAVVVIAVVALLAALLLPAVHKARETARRTGCLANLKQLGIAVQSYHDAFRVLPSDGTGIGFSFHARLAGYLEQPAMAVAFNEDWQAAYLEYQYVRVPVFVCPSHPADRAVTTYGLNWGTRFLKDKEDGFFVSYRPVRIQHVTDGASNTALIAEFRAHLSSDPRSVIWTTPYVLTSPGDESAFAELCESMSVDGKPFTGSHGVPWPDFNATCYDHFLPPNRRNCLNGEILPGSYSPDNSTFNSGSHHPGGANVLLVDGSTHFVSDSIDRGVWRAFGSRSGNDVLPSNW